MMEEKGLAYELVTEFRYVLLMSAEGPLARKARIAAGDLTDLIEIAHADPYVPSIPTAEVRRAELQEDVRRRIYVFERASQFELLSQNPQTFMWVSPVPKRLLERYGLVQRACGGNGASIRTCWCTAGTIPSASWTVSLSNSSWRRSARSSQRPEAENLNVL